MAWSGIPSIVHNVSQTMFFSKYRISSSSFFFFGGGGGGGYFYYFFFGVGGLESKNNIGKYRKTSHGKK